MTKHEKVTQGPVQTKNEQKRLITQNQSILVKNEKEILKLVTDYLDFNECTEPMDAIGFLQQEFLEKHKNISEVNPHYLCNVNFQVNQLFLLLAKLQICKGNVSTSSRMLNLLTSNPA